MTIRKGKAYTASFAAIDAASRPARKSGLSFIAGDTKISKDGAAFANTTNAPTELASTGRYKLDLTATEMAADNIHVYVEKTGMDPMDLVVSTGGQPSALVAADGGNTASTFKTDLTESTNDYWKDALLLFTTGSLNGQVKRVSAYNGTTKFVTLSSAFTAAPSTGDRFVLVNL